jgi:hypothetical protein
MTAIWKYRKFHFDTKQQTLSHEDRTQKLIHQETGLLKLPCLNLNQI